MDLAGYADRTNGIYRYSKSAHELHSSSFEEALHDTADGADLRQTHSGPHQCHHSEYLEQNLHEATSHAQIQQVSPGWSELYFAALLHL
ncbi:hypothetical protein D3C85_1621260 [compost metagenome]